MRRILALIVAPALLSAANPIASETLPAVADFDGLHGGGFPIGLVVIAAGFVFAGGWLLWLSSRSRG